MIENNVDENFIEILDKCNLLQACEWIALNWDPMEKAFEEYSGHIRPNSIEAKTNTFGSSYTPQYTSEEYNKRISKAKAQLRVALIQKRIIALGIPYIPEPQHGDLYIGLTHKNLGTNRRNLGTHRIPTELQPIDFLRYYDIDLKGNAILDVQNRPIANFITINFEQLKRAFKKAPKHNNSTGTAYKSIYMHMMEEIINEEGITDEQQSKKEVLKDVVTNKMKQYNLPESAHLADAIATIIRQPKSQKGRNKKG